VKRLADYLFRSKSEDTTLRPKLLIFDFDGTIADTFHLGFGILNTLAPEFKYRTLKESEVEAARDMRLLELLKFLKIKPSKMGKIARRAAEELSARIREVQPLPEVMPVIRELAARGFQLGILTSNSPENVGIFLKNHDFQVFDFVRSSSKLMGKAREIKAIRKILRVHRSEILLVGDECRDIEAAHKAGVAIAAIAGGYNSRLALERTKPQFLLDRPEELLNLLRAPGAIG
jgi:HAD superfamily hydrolase (TIGR01549 family)